MILRWCSSLIWLYLGSAVCLNPLLTWGLRAKTCWSTACSDGTGISELHLMMFMVMHLYRRLLPQTLHKWRRALLVMILVE
jgi:hypothetical protein